MKTSLIKMKTKAIINGYITRMISFIFIQILFMRMSLEGAITLFKVSIEINHLVKILLFQMLLNT